MNSNESNHKLTDEQRELAAENHNLIYSYAHKRNISIDEYYDILAIALCKAAKSFDKSRGNFSTIAFKCMDNELNFYWRSNSKKSSVPDEMIFSYDAPMDVDDLDGNNFAESISNSGLSEDMVDDIISSMFVSELTYRDRFIVECLLNGMTHKEIGDIIGCRQQNVTYLVKQIRKKASKYLLCN